MCPKLTNRVPRALNSRANINPEQSETKQYRVYNSVSRGSRTTSESERGEFVLAFKQ